MRLLRPVLVLCVACCAACSRPTLDDAEGDSDGSVASEDTGTPPAHVEPHVDPPTPLADAGAAPVDATSPPARDAGTPIITVPTADAGCSSADGGCDTLPPVLADCSGASVMSAVGSSTVDRVTINGQSQTVAQVQAGDSVDIGLRVSFGACGAVSAQQFYLSVGSADSQCKNTGCSSVVPISQPFSFQLTAPSEPGLHYILAGLGTSSTPTTATFDCAAAATASPTIPVAALCVSAKK